MSLQISTGDVVVGHGAIDLYWGRNGMVWCCRSILGTMLKRMKKKVQVGKDQEKAQSEKDSHSKNRGGKKPN